MTAAPAPNLAAQNLLQLGSAARRAGLILAFLAAGGAASLQLSGLDPRAPPGADSASFRSQVVLGLAYVVILGAGVAAGRRGFGVLGRNAIFLAPPALAILSCLWAPEPAVALRRAAAFAATMLSGLALAAALPGRRALAFVAQAAGAGVVLSLCYIWLQPAHAVHQATDGAQSVHVGDWRGLFIHRTALGQLSALTLAFAAYGGRTALGPPLVRLAVGAAALLCLWKAGSGGGVADAVLLLTAPPLLRVAVWGWRRGGWIAAGAAACGGVLALGAAPTLLPPALHALGKDATLTGRADFWPAMLEAAKARPWFGYGYSTGYRTAVAGAIAARTGFGYVPNAQNGYLDALLNLGGVGLALALAGLVVAGARAVRLACRTVEAEVTPLLVVVLIGAMNVVEAALVSGNDLFVLIYATMAAAAGEALRRLPRSDRSPADGAPDRRPAGTIR